MKKRALAIINPISGVKSKTTIPQQLQEAFNNSEWELFITYTKRSMHAYELASEAVDKGFELVIAIGGDGTINEIAKALVNKNASLGIIPRGSGNGLANALGIPKSSKKAIDIIVKGNKECIDSCTINDNAFFCTTGLGFDAEVSKKFAEESSRGPLQYIITTVSQYINYEPEEYKIIIDGKEEINTKAFVVAIANASQYGNNAYIAPNASLTDGFMDLVVLEPFTSMEMPNVVMQLFNKKLDKNIHQYTYRVKKVEIIRNSKGVIHLDGEPKEMPDKLSIEIIEKSLNVIVP